MRTIYDDPIADLRHQVRMAIGMFSVGLVVTWLLIAALH